MHPLKKEILMILTLQLYSPSVTDKIPSDLLPATSRPSFCSEIHAEICVFKKEKKKANNPLTPRPELALRINYLCLQPQKLLRLQGFSSERGPVQRDARLPPSQTRDSWSTPGNGSALLFLSCC